MSMLSIIKHKVLAEYSNNLLYFSEPCIVHNAEFFNFRIWGVQVSPNDELYVMDNEGKMHQLQERKQDATVIYQLYHFMQKHIFTSKMRGVAA